MKKILGAAAMLVLTLSLITATAQEQPKKVSVKEAKMGCCSTAKKDVSKADKCGTDGASKASKENCDKSKCGDDCKMAHNSDVKKTDDTKKAQSENKN